MLTKNWAMFKLECNGIITHIVIDTTLFPENAPYVVRMQGVFLEPDRQVNTLYTIISHAYVSFV